ncbi:MAG: sensor histidine kinase, partial [Desulfovibrionaceae bacterium]
RATLSCDDIPRSEGRATLRWMTIAVAAIMLVGLASIYQSARVVVDTSERRSNFVSAVTHELKTPLTNIRMYIEMLEQGMARTPQREQEYYRILGEETTRLSRLITNVLEFSRLESRRRKLDLAQGDFHDVLVRVRELMADTLEKEGFELVIDAPDEVPLFGYDPEVMVGVVMNLMENSVKFGARCGEKRITIHVQPHGGKVRVAVSDTGPGIPPHALKHVFDDFYRAEDEMTRSTKGTGIGLALVKKFVTAMGGVVRAERNKGPGCTISMTFPVAKTKG